MDMTFAESYMQEMESLLQQAKQEGDPDKADQALKKFDEMNAKFKEIVATDNPPEFVTSMIEDKFRILAQAINEVKENIVPTKNTTTTTTEPPASAAPASNPTTQGTSAEPTVSEPDSMVEIAKAVQSLTSTVTGIANDIKNAKATKEAKKAAEAAKPVAAKVKDKAKSYAGFGLKALEIGAGAGIVIFAAMVGVRVGRKAGNAVADKLVGSSPAPAPTVMIGGQPVEVVETPVLTKA